MSGSRHAHSLTASPGPVDQDDVDCGHGGTLFATDPPEWAVEPCHEPAVWRVELPNTLGTITVCPYHLHRWADAYPDRADAYGQQFERFDAAQPSRCWTTGRDLPRLTHGDGEIWTRLGLDQRGHARYYRDHPDGHRLLTFAPGWTVEDLRLIGGDLEDVLDHVAATVGWVDIDPQETELLAGGGRGGE